MGKSSAVQMLCAYYDKTCDSASLFDDLDVVEGRGDTGQRSPKNGKKLIMIIDEWDALVRESRDHPDFQRKYLEFLRSLFKNRGLTSKTLAAVYMTGILPVKKDGS